MSTKKHMFLTQSYMDNSLPKNNYRSSFKERATVADPTNYSLGNISQANDFTSKILERQIMQIEHDILELESLKNSNFGLGEQIDLMQNEVRQTWEQFQNKKIQYETEISEVSNQLGFVTKEKLSNEKEIELIEQEIENLCDMFDRKEGSCETEEENIQILDDQNENLLQSNSDLTNEIESIKFEIKGKLELNEDLKDRMMAAKNEFRSLNKQTGELKAATQEINKTVKRVNNEGFDIESLLVKKQKQECDLETERDYLAKELELCRDENYELELELNDLNLQLENLKSGSNQYDRIKMEHQNLLDSLRSDKIRFLSELEDKRSDIRNSQQHLNEKEYLIQNLGNQLKELQEKKENCLNETDKLAREVQRQKGINDKVRQIVQGQRYLEGLLRTSSQKNNDILNNL